MGSITLVATINPGGIGGLEQFTSKLILPRSSTSTHRRNSWPFFFSFPQNSRLKTNFFFFYLSNRTHVPPALLYVCTSMTRFSFFFFFLSLQESYESDIRSFDILVTIDFNTRE